MTIPGKNPVSEGVQMPGLEKYDGRMENTSRLEVGMDTGKNSETAICFEPIGYVRTHSTEVPRFYSVSDVEGSLVIDECYMDGLCDITPGDRLTVIFCFHESPSFDIHRLHVRTSHSGKIRGVFSSRSPVRPNPVGLSVLEVIGVRGNIIDVRGLDMLDGTPILDLKPVAST